MLHLSFTCPRCAAAQSLRDERDRYGPVHARREASRKRLVDAVDRVAVHGHEEAGGELRPPRARVEERRAVRREGRVLAPRDGVGLCVVWCVGVLRVAC